MHVSKLNVMDSEVEDDVQSELSRGTDRPSKTVAQESTPISRKSEVHNFNYPAKSERSA